MAPLVSVVCLAHNHGLFVRQALDSVIHQTYKPLELLVVDDASTDNTATVIREWLSNHPGTRFIDLAENIGNCRAFNKALREARGKYIIDLSADDELLPQRIERGVELLERRPEVGVQFSDAVLIDPSGKAIGLHSDRFPHDTIAQGMIFKEVLSRYFINSPTMMIRKSLLDELGGYDEVLAYEDFDFWVRSTPRTQYAYLPEALVRRRMLHTSMGKHQYQWKSRQARSTLVVCRKALALCKNPEERDALRMRVAYEWRQAIRVGNISLVLAYAQLWLQAR